MGFRPLSEGTALTFVNVLHGLRHQVVPKNESRAVRSQCGRGQTFDSTHIKPLPDLQIAFWLQPGGCVIRWWPTIMDTDTVKSFEPLLSHSTWWAQGWYPMLNLSLWRLTAQWDPESSLKHANPSALTEQWVQAQLDFFILMQIEIFRISWVTSWSRLDVWNKKNASKSLNDTSLTL